MIKNMFFNEEDEGWNPLLIGVLVFVLEEQEERRYGARRKVRAIKIRTLGQRHQGLACHC